MLTAVSLNDERVVLHSTVIAIRCNHRWLLSSILLCWWLNTISCNYACWIFFLLLKLFLLVSSHKVINLSRMSMLIEHVILDCHYCHLLHITCAQQLYFDFLINPWGCENLQRNFLPSDQNRFLLSPLGEWFIIYSWQLLCALLHVTSVSRG